MVQRTGSPVDAPAAIAILEGPGLVLTWVNQRWYDMLGKFTQEEVVGRSITEYLPGAGSPEMERAINNTLDTGEASYLTGEFVGSHGVMGMVATIERLPDGKLIVTAWHPYGVPIAEADGPVGRVRVGREAAERS